MAQGGIDAPGGIILGTTQLIFKAVMSRFLGAP